MAELDLHGHQYRAGKISAREQFHIVRRLAPLLGEVAPLAGAKNPIEALPPLANALAAMPDESADYVLFGLLKAVQRKEPQGLGWSAVCSGTSIMYDDIGMAEMVQLAWLALRENLQDFFRAIPPALNGGSQKQSAP